MTHGPHPSDDPDRGLDVDARFAEIIAGWEPSPPEADPDRSTDRPQDLPEGRLDDAAASSATDEAPNNGPNNGPSNGPSEAPPAERLRGLFQPSWKDPLETDASWEDEGHFVPPPPPPLPVVEPHRRLAWAGLLGTPIVTLLLIAAGVRVAGWMAFVLAAAFIGGFGYLVATMRSGPPDDWPGDDGARL